jgi:hypothetical protein
MEFIRVRAFALRRPSWPGRRACRETISYKLKALFKLSFEDGRAYLVRAQH